MIIKLAEDYRGVLTNEAYYLAGKYAVPGEMPEGHANALLAAGRAVEVKEEAKRDSPKPTPKAEPEPKAAVTKRTRSKKATQ